MSEVGKTLINLRKVKSLSQGTLAKKAKVSQSTIAQLENGKKQPSVETLAKICKALNIKRSYFFSLVETGSEIVLIPIKEPK